MDIREFTLEQISVSVLFIVGFIGGIRYLKGAIEGFVEKSLDSKFNTMNNKLDELQALITKLDTYSTKNFLVRYLADTERGNMIYEAEKQRFWEEYDHYTNDLKENSYIKEWVARLRDEGKLQR